MAQTAGGMNRRRFLQVASGSAAALLLPGGRTFGQNDAPHARPNFLWISTEDISPDLGCYGDAYAVTPNLDRLAQRGVRYNNVFSHSGVCAPTRSGIITGMYPTTIGTHHMRCAGVPPEQVKCFPEYLRAAGYYCTNNSKTDYQFASPLTAWDECSNAADWRNRPEGKPFFAVINFTVTHESQIRNRSAAMLNRLAGLGPDERHDPAQAKLSPYYPDTPKVRQDWAQYYDLITLMDKQVAGVLQQLEDDGLAEETIVWFWGDHGRGLPRAKRWIYDSGLRVPLIVRVPEKWRRLAMPDDPGAVQPGTVNDDLIAFIDFAPTVLSLAGIDIPDHIQGRAFLGRQKAKPREYIYAARDRMDEAYDLIRAVRDKRYKYIRNYLWYVTRGQDIDYMNQMPTMQEMRRLNAEGALEGPQKQYFEPTKPLEELYDTVADPHEVHNLAADPEHAEALERLRQAHAEWYGQTQDVGLIPEPILDEMKWPDGKQETTAQPVFTRQQGGAVTVACATRGASIAYRIGGDPKNATGWLLYTRPVRLQSGETLHAKACRIGFSDSEVATFRLGDPLADRPAPARTELWLDRLDATNLRQRLWKLRQLDFEGPNANHLYVDYLDAEFAPTRYWAVEGLRANGRYAVDREYALEPLRARLEDTSVAVRVAAARTLCEWGSGESALPVLIAALEHRTAKARLLAVIALSQIGKRAQPALAQVRKMATDDPDEYVRRVATTMVQRAASAGEAG
ncbi:MAG: sulfatase-like hydrolase/transferase [Sedimentisphaerales bacterium]|nr:sulfatase-like hydrolase/transferase [Sedimentisphaerales bacterium]